MQTPVDGVQDQPLSLRSGVLADHLRQLPLHTTDREWVLEMRGHVMERPDDVQEASSPLRVRALPFDVAGEASSDVHVDGVHNKEVE